jgi:hypothetical protein
MKSKGVLILLAGLLVLALAGTAAAGNFVWDATGDSTVQQGKSIDLTLGVTATGSLEVDKPDPAFTVNTAYTIGDGSATPTTLDGFNRTSRYNPQGNRIPDAVSGSASAILTLSAPLGLTPGLYNVTITPTSSKGMDVSPLSLTYKVNVTAAEEKPNVTINSPANGSSYLYGAAIPVSVTVDPAVDAVLADLDGVSTTLDFDAESGNWTGSLTGLSPGSHTFTASATNSAGTGTATSTFSVVVNFGQWLPPIVTSNKQMKAGSTLPVKFTIVGANGPVDDSVAKPEVTLNGVSKGFAKSFLDSTTGLPYFQLDIKLPAAGSYQVGVKEANMTSVSMGIITK